MEDILESESHAPLAKILTALRCPGCGGALRPWRRARARTVRDPGGCDFGFGPLTLGLLPGALVGDGPAAAGAQRTNDPPRLPAA